ARGRKHRRLGADRRDERYRPGYGRPPLNRRCRGDRAGRMQCELTNGTESRVGAELRGRDTVARSRALMKMSGANNLRDEQQRRAEHRYSACRCPAAPMKSGYHQIFRLGKWRRIPSPIEPAAWQPDVSSALQPAAVILIAANGRETRGGFFAFNQVVYASPSHPRRQSTFCSYAYAIFSGVESSKCRPTIINPTGSPLDFAHGTLTAGCPVISNGAVLVIIEYGACLHVFSGPVRRDLRSDPLPRRRRYGEIIQRE